MPKNRSSLRIGINGRFLTIPYTGIGQHSRYLFEALANLRPDITLIVAVPSEAPVKMPGNVEIHVLPEKFPGSAGMRKTYWEQRQVPLFFKEHQVDLAHFPYPSNPWTGFEKPVCVTVHDTIPWESEAYRKSLTTRLYQDSCRFAVKKADHVFTVSEASKHDVIRMCRVPDNTISLTSNAPAPHFSVKMPELQRAKILQKYGLDPSRKFFFYVGGYDERKNVRMLLDAYERVIAPDHAIDLVLAGGKAVNDPLYESFDSILRRNHSSRPGRIRTTGFIEETDLPAFYQSAFVFFNVSVKEGCNLPLLEALTSGTPVVTSDIPVHHEMVGNHALYTGIHDAGRLGAIMDQFLRDEKFYEARKRDAESYRCPFSWGKSAQSVLEIYERLSSRKPVV